MTHPSPALRFAPASRGEGHSVELAVHLNRVPFAPQSGEKVPKADEGCVIRSVSEG